MEDTANTVPKGGGSYQTYHFLTVILTGLSASYPS